MLLLLIILVVLLLLLGGGVYGRRAGWGPRGFLGLVLTILIIIALVWTLNELLMPPVPMPAGQPSIMR